MLTVDNQVQVEKLLVDEKLLTAAQLTQHKQVATKAKQPLLAYLSNEKIIDEEALTKLLAKANAIPYVRLIDVAINTEVLKLLPAEVAERYMAVPLGMTEGRLAVAMLDANNVQAVDFLAKKIGRPLRVYMASESGIRSVISQYPSDIGTAADQLIETPDLPEAGAAKSRATDIKNLVQDSPISRALSSILDFAVRARASDIHIEPAEHDLKIRARIDGVLSEIMTLPKSIEPALISRIKILSNLKIDEHRVPQDGQFQIEVLKREVDLRIAISPVVWGEQVVIRILDKTAALLDLPSLGFTGRSLDRIKEGIRKPHGMVISSGPTGSGKSTTLYALINEIKSGEVNIVTLEDPVEYKMEGVNQIQINPDVGLTFASGLRSVLRQDLDIVMVGEIRDKETATLAIQAALTGHLVFSTLHTNSAAGVLPRLLDMGIEPFLIASTVNTVIAQRLVRRLQEDKISRPATPAEKVALDNALRPMLPPSDKEAEELAKTLGYEHLPTKNQSAYTLYEGKKTRSVPTGYKGRVGLYEVFNISPAIEQQIVNHASSNVIQDQAQKEGMITMRQDGYLKALNGLTSIDEVNRVAAES